MKVLCISEKKCANCAKKSNQSIYLSALGFDQPNASLDGTDALSRRWRGIEVCVCGFAAPDIENPDGLITKKVISAEISKESYIKNLGIRHCSEVAKAGDPWAMHWFAYANAFENYLTKELSGYAWLNALQELQAPRLHRSGECALNIKDADDKFVQLAKNKVIGYFSQLIDAEFPSNRFFPTSILRAVNRYKIGETVKRQTRLTLCAQEFKITNCTNYARFEIACALTDTLRKNKDFDNARKVCERVSKNSKIPLVFEKIFNFQTYLINNKDSNSYNIQQADQFKTNRVLDQSFQSNNMILQYA